MTDHATSDQKYPQEAIESVADILEDNFDDIDTDNAVQMTQTGWIQDAATVADHYDIEETEYRIDLLIDGLGWYMDRKKQTAQSDLRQSLTAYVSLFEF